MLSSKPILSCGTSLHCPLSHNGNERPSIISTMLAPATIFIRSPPSYLSRSFRTRWLHHANDRVLVAMFGVCMNRDGRRYDGLLEATEDLHFQVTVDPNGV